jgi:exodeoxyribonuclease VII small subunit
LTKRPTKTTLDFESALKELEMLVDKLEHGELNLDESLRHFERGVELTRSCQQALKDAEQKVSMLVEKDGKTDLESFENPDEQP